MTRAEKSRRAAKQARRAQAEERSLREHAAPPRLEIPEKESDPYLTHGFLKRLDLTAVGGSSHSRCASEAEIEGIPGNYQLEWALQSPAAGAPAASNLEIGPTTHADSLLILPPHTTLTISGVFGVGSGSESQVPTQLAFLPNQEGRLAIIQATVDAQSFLDAEAKGWTILAPLLSAWAFAYDVPLEVARLNAEHVLTHTTRTFQYRLPYRHIDFHSQFMNDWQLPQWYHPLVYYREALASVSPHYQFLCYYKAGEVVKRLRTFECKTSELDGIPLRTICDRLVADDQLRAALAPDLLRSVEGRTFNDIHVNVLRPIRNRVVHAFEDEALGKQPPKEREEWIQVMTDELNKETEALLFGREIYQYLPLAHTIARRMIIAQFAINLPDQYQST